MDLEQEWKQDMDSLCSTEEDKKEERNFLPKQQRMRSRDFIPHFNSPCDKFSTACINITYCTSSGGKLGIKIPKRHVLLAVDRNKYKRIIRELIRIHIILKSYSMIISVKSHVTAEDIKDSMLAYISYLECLP